MNLKKINAFIHLWLGLVSGLVVFIVGITGCIFAFEAEIKNALEDYRFVTVQAKPIMAPAPLTDKVLNQLQPMPSIKGITYPISGQAVIIYYQLKNKSEWTAYVNPYSGKVIKTKPQSPGFFDIILNLHVALLIPGKVGQAVVAYSTLIFIILLISGFILWWPKKWNKSARKRNFSIKWNAKFKRLNYDLHNVPGFYGMLFTFFIAFSGLMIGLPWFGESVYWLASGGNSLPKRIVPQSKALNNAVAYQNGIDLLWSTYEKKKPGIGKINLSISYPETKRDVITLVYNPKPGTAYKSEIHYYDQYSLAKIEMPHFWQKDYAKAHLGICLGDLHLTFTRDK